MIGLAIWSGSSPWSMCAGAHARGAQHSHSDVMAWRVAPSEDALQVRFWGVRGSTCASGPQFVEFGGHTPCVEVRCGVAPVHRRCRHRASRPSGPSSAPRAPREVDILLSHLHLDHVGGLPFFKPSVLSGDRIDPHPLRQHGRRERRGGARAALRAADLPDRARPAAGPVRASGLPGRRDPDLPGRRQRRHHPAQPSRRRDRVPLPPCAAAASATSATSSIPTPGRTRTSPASCAAPTSSSTTACSPRPILRPASGWGHSTWQKGVELCQAAEVKALAIFHLYPGHNDAALSAAEAEMQAVMPTAFIARERQAFTFPAGLTARSPASRREPGRAADSAAVPAGLAPGSAAPGAVADRRRRDALRQPDAPPGLSSPCQSCRRRARRLLSAAPDRRSCKPVPPPLCAGAAERPLEPQGADAAGRRHRVLVAAASSSRLAALRPAPPRPARRSPAASPRRRSPGPRRRGRRHPARCRPGRGSLLQVVAVGRGRRAPPTSGSCPTAAALARARPPDPRRHLVREPRQLHGRARLDHRRRDGADHRLPGGPRRRRAGCRRRPRSSRPPCAAALLGFAPFNRPVARLFLGDVGLAADRPPGRLAARAARRRRGARGGAPAAALLSRRRDAHPPAPAPRPPRAGLGGASQPFLPAGHRQRLLRAWRSAAASSPSTSRSPRSPAATLAWPRRRSQIAALAGGCGLVGLTAPALRARRVRRRHPRRGRPVARSRSDPVTALIALTGATGFIGRHLLGDAAPARLPGPRAPAPPRRGAAGGVERGDRRHRLAAQHGGRPARRRRRHPFGRDRPRHVGPAGGRLPGHQHGGDDRRSPARPSGRA